MALPKPKRHRKLKAEKLRWKCDPEIFEFDSTSDLEPIEGILGQERALKALKLGVELKSPGYNIFIVGLSGTGKATTVKHMLEAISSDCPELKDYAYVNNFRDNDCPLLLTFPAGKAKEFKQDLFSCISFLKDRIPQVLESEGFINRKKKIISEFNDKEQSLLRSFEEKIKKDNFSLGQVKVGEIARPDIIPIIEEKPVPVYMLDEYIEKGKLTKDKAQNILKKYNLHQQELQAIFKKGLKLSQDFQIKLVELEKDAALNVVKGAIGNLIDKYQDRKAADYLSQVEVNILENLQVFKGFKPEGETTSEGFIIDYFKEYDVNIILDNSSVTECPVIIETSPTYTNLFGTIEKISDGKGGWYSDFTRIKSGSLLKANNGYLVLYANHLFEEPGVWKTLKRVLTYRKLEIQDSYSYFPIAPSILKPESIEIDTKVIMIGSQMIYSLLAEFEDDFKKIFKVKADFDYEIKRNERVLIEYAKVIKKLIKEEKLLEFNKSAIAYLAELGARFSGRQDKLTTRFSIIADMAREANFWAIDDGFNIVNEAHVIKAYNNARDRHGLLETKISDMIESDTIMISTEGKRIGQINGLAVYGMELYPFGRPTRITASVSLGNGNIINVEREAGMSGKTYNKGVLIISGYFKETFGQNFPLSFNANLVFEQSYGTVDGDSASAAEIFALLSTLSEIPIDQSIAVTGSLNQKGDIQPIGGVNEKIEGFYDVCKSRGLNKKQGVIIPNQNALDLMLREDVVESVRKGEFSIYAIETVEEGIEILTGKAAGKRNLRGNFEVNTVFGAVERKLKVMYKKSKPVSRQKSSRGKIKKK